MKVVETKLKDAFILEPQLFGDQRGYFFESYNQKALKEATGLEIAFVQDNQSKSKYGVLRGLHYQLNPHAQTKLVRVSEGVVLDVMVDVRKDSPTYGKHISVILSQWNRRQVLVPKGFAHGFVTLSEYATMQYKCDNFYAPEFDAGIQFNDPELGIDWQIPKDHIILSEKDQKLLPLSIAENNFEYGVYG